MFKTSRNRIILYSVVKMKSHVEVDHSLPWQDEKSFLFIFSTLPILSTLPYIEAFKVLSSLVETFQLKKDWEHWLVLMFKSRQNTTTTCNASIDSLYFIHFEYSFFVIVYWFYKLKFSIIWDMRLRYISRRLVGMCAFNGMAEVALWRLRINWWTI